MPYDIDLNANYDNMTFGKAFASARKSGKRVFNWRGKPYTTQLASEVKVKSLTPQKTENQIDDSQKPYTDWRDYLQKKYNERHALQIDQKPTTPTHSNQEEQTTTSFNWDDLNTKQDRGRIARDYLSQELGLKDYQASALVGTFMRESGLNINAENKAEKAGKNSAVNPSQYGIGIGQWTHGRHDNFVKWIGEHGNTLQSQLDFAIDEIKNKYPQYLNMLRQANNVDDASDYTYTMYTGANYRNITPDTLQSYVDKLEGKYRQKSIELYGRDTNNHAIARRNAARDVLGYKFGGILKFQSGGPTPYQKQYDLKDNPFNLYKATQIEKPTVEKHSLSEIPGINMGNLNTIADRLKEEGFTKEQSAAILATVAEESHANPKAIGDKGAAKGLFQWHGSRFKADDSLESQVNLIINELRDIKDINGWGPSTKFRRSSAIEAFNSGNLEDTVTALTHNFIRPQDKDGATKRRFQLAQQIYNELL